MATRVAGRRDLLIDDHDSKLAENVLQSLEGPEGFLSVARTDAAAEPLPRDIGVLLQEVLRAVASGSTVTVTTTPQEVTTSTAAAMLGISRPTLMKMVKDGTIPAHKVGTHTRLRTEDVLAAKRARRERERAAFAALLELEGDEE
ncbi:helix-turn-helix domain-containing protein [Cellulomonas xiejunii]|uniref:helix-turn-helix domain-containing protein n=1 Tax=Cellulomonas xiejunii TaxID=2968083 RepID=UPI001D0E4229|nr:helix-turn-helix domain-containing protein [Cellulomonas xiejunii]MCC2314187.1 helix-turn-helix domain-containing protein [Cellulomonas xiejunii]